MLLLPGAGAAAVVVVAARTGASAARTNAGTILTILHRDGNLCFHYRYFSGYKTIKLSMLIAPSLKIYCSIIPICNLENIFSGINSIRTLIFWPFLLIKSAPSIVDGGLRLGIGSCLTPAQWPHVALETTGWSRVFDLSSGRASRQYYMNKNLQENNRMSE